MFISVLLLLVILYQSIRILVGRKSDSVKCLIRKTAIVTGGNAGIGYGTSLLLASRGCKVIIADKVNAEASRDKIIKATGNPNISYMYLDLSSLQSVRNFSEDIKKSENKIDILINNAGIGASKPKTTEDGLNYVMQVNFFGAFLLTHLLLEPLKAAGSARVIFVSSITILLHDLTLNNLNITDFESNDYYIKLFYCNSKLCNVLAAQEFGKKLLKYGITANSVDPMLVRTGIYNKTYEMYTDWTYKFLLWLGIVFAGQDGLNGAQTLLHLACSEKLENTTGGHYACCIPIWRPRILNNQPFCDQIWKKTEDLVKLKPEEKLH